jgi:thymidylate synthase ThyX
VGVSVALDTAPPKITLRASPAVPYDSAIAAARTCYSPRVIDPSEITDKQRDSIGPLTFDGGHHTVFQHASFEFGMENISRQLVWSVLHAYPFYNSEQSSQRYVKLREPRAFVPPLDGEALDVYTSAVLRAWDAYAELSALLKDEAWAILKELRYVRPTNSAERLRAVEREAEKKAIETARYVIPLGAFTSMVHTVSGIVLHRLHRMVNAGDTPHEAKLVIGEMVDLVRAQDPFFFEKVGLETLEPADLPEMAFLRPRASADAFVADFDRRLDGRVSRLRDWSAGAESVVADAVRSTFGLTEAEMADDEAIDAVMNPARNRYRVEMLNVSYHSPLMRALHHASYVFEKKLSHTADSQDQRHRMVPASRPMLTFADTTKPDYVTPALIRKHPRAAAVYERAMTDAWAAKNRLLELGVPLEFALYVLPNAKALRLVESGSLIALQHKWTLRTCFNAQEEIYLASMDEIAQVAEVHPRLAKFLGPPCVLRNRIVSPRCTEGSHFCGVPVWQSFPNAERRL